MNTNDSMNGKVAVITGGNSGIGRATAIAFARRGVKVVIAARRKSLGQGVVDEINQTGGQAIFVETDVRIASEVKNMVDQAVKTYGRLDFAFNNAGEDGEHSLIAEQSETNYDLIMDTNVKGVWLSMKYEIEQMLRQGTGGAIVNNSSVSGLIAFNGAGIYTASKHAVVGLTKAAGTEYAKQGIRTNAVCPGGVETPMFAKLGDDPAIRAAVNGMHPIGRMGQPEEVAELVVWLCSDAASFVTAAAVAVDGGFTAN